MAAVPQALQRIGWVEGAGIRASTIALLLGTRLSVQSVFTDFVDLISRLKSGKHRIPAPPRAPEVTRTIPTVFVLVPDPVGLGFVQSFPRPGGNMTGFISYDAPLIGKWVQLLKEIAPGITRVAAIFNPETAYPPSFIVREIEAASSVGVTGTLARVHDSTAIEEVVAAQAREPGRGLLILPDSFNVRHRDVIIGAANRHRLPFIGFDVFATAGGLMTYFADAVDLHVQATAYTGRFSKARSRPICRSSAAEVELTSTSRLPKRSASPCRCR